MFGLKKSPLKAAKRNSVDPLYPASSGSNPFDDEPAQVRQNEKHALVGQNDKQALFGQNTSTNPFDGDQGKENTNSYTYKSTYAERNKYKNDFRDSGGVENQSVQELESYAVYKAEETTNSVNSCLRIAEDIREDATKTLVMLHHQGDQITRTHFVAADIEQDLSRGEKLLGSLGGIFSKTWKPKKGRTITGPVITADAAIKRSSQSEREKLGLTPAPKGLSHSRTPLPEPTNALQKVEVEKAKQDDGLSDLSNLLGELKDMAVDMGSEIDRHNKAIAHMDADVDELHYRVRGATQRGRRLLGK
ncbi:putative target SNARE coiled-coil domain-containing protein [Rosa chinensis]|uniref:Putative target SNARE coiled-coil domain-containing protein n=1 Tax=Rosa chinensis TaxID=74649 RepID=A0A2P6P2X2_ROSCH|nr:SNAP25 homologous protein SNAP33 [Rosa chinensis]PRQ16288.1 putative target SNARE coiled-coil domain-containing protein [Rosa chinensis]